MFKNQILKRITPEFSECEKKSWHKSERLTEHFAAIFCSAVLC